MLDPAYLTTEEFTQSYYLDPNETSLILDLIDVILLISLAHYLIYE